MVKIHATYTGNLGNTCTHEPSGAEIKTAAPVDNNGDGSSFSPTDLVANALLTCKITLMGIAANTHQISIEGTTGSVEKHMVANPRRIGKLVVSIHVPQSVTKKEQQLLLAAAQTCPVLKSIHPDIEIDFTLTFNAVSE